MRGQLELVRNLTGSRLNHSVQHDSAAIRECAGTFPEPSPNSEASRRFRLTKHSNAQARSHRTTMIFQRLQRRYHKKNKSTMGRKSSSLRLPDPADAASDGVYFSARKPVHDDDWSDSTDDTHSESEGSLSSHTSSWKSSGSKDHHKGSPLIVSSPESNRSIDDEVLELGRKMARSRHLPGTWYFASNHIMVNQERKDKVIAPLVRLAELDSLARYHAEEMAEADRLFHSDPDALNYAFPRESRRLGENVAKGGSVAEIHDAMMKTKSQKNNILDRRYTNMGMATARGKDGQLFLCQIFRG